MDEWVTFEYARVYRLYDRLKIPARTRINHFRGVHEINGVGTFAFIAQHFGRPAPPLGGRK